MGGQVIQEEINEAYLRIKIILCRRVFVGTFQNVKRCCFIATSVNEDAKRKMKHRDLKSGARGLCSTAVSPGTHGDGLSRHTERGREHVLKHETQECQ